MSEKLSVVGQRVKMTAQAMSQDLHRGDPAKTRGICVMESKDGKKIYVRRDGLRSATPYSVEFWELEDAPLQPAPPKQNTITKAQYQQLLGLQLLAKRHWKALAEIERAAFEITQEKDHDGEPSTMGHTYDALCGSRDMDEALKLMKIEIAK